MYIYIYIYIYKPAHFDVQQKLTEHCKSTIIKNVKKMYICTMEYYSAI